MAQPGPAEIVDRVAELVCERYVFADRGAAAAAAIRARVDSYQDLAPEPLCAALTADLRTACPDLHLSVEYHPVAGEVDSEATLVERARLDNFGVARVERFAGNVGYLDLRAIHTARLSGPALTAAMTLLAHTYALLLDLRANRGGAPDGVAYLCSFFLPDEPVHLNTVHRRVDASVRQFWSYPHLPGPRYLDRAVYVLIGPRTFSGGEEIAYNLQQLGRATLVGETTRGGAHPVEDHWITPHIRLRVPGARSVNPISGTNWEATGVAPDVGVPSANALGEAYRRALGGVLDVLGETPEPSQRTVHSEVRATLDER